MAANQELLDVAGLRWQFVEGDRDITSSPSAELDACEARLWSEDGAMVVSFTRPTADHFWIADYSDYLTPAGIERIPSVRSVDDLDIGELLDAEALGVDLNDSTIWGTNR